MTKQTKTVKVSKALKKHTNAKLLIEGKKLGQVSVVNLKTEQVLRAIYFGFDKPEIYLTDQGLRKFVFEFNIVRQGVFADVFPEVIHNLIFRCFVRRIAVL